MLKVLRVSVVLLVAIGGFFAFTVRSKSDVPNEAETPMYGYCVIAGEKKDVDKDVAEVVSQPIVFSVQVRRYIGVLPDEDPEPVQNLFTKDEVLMIAKTLTVECGGLMSQGAKYGVSYTARQAAVAWCILNRLDDPDFPDTVAGVLTYPNAFAYNAKTVPFPEMERLAEDVTMRYSREKVGEENVGRTLPSNFFFFAGNGKENRFRDNYSAPFTYWDWTLDDPYEKG